MELIKNYLAGGTIYKNRIVKHGASDGYALQASANTDLLLGVALIPGPDDTAYVSSAERLDVVKDGQAEIILAGVVARGEQITPDSDGKGVKLTDTMLESGACWSIGTAEVSGVSGDIILVNLNIQKVSKFDAVTASAAELNYNDVTTLGTVQASKAVTADANKDVTGFRNITVGTTGAITLGTLSSANDTSGIALSASKTKALAINADTGGSALDSGFIRAGVSRMLIGTAITSGADISVAGFEGLLKSIVSVNVGGNQGGVCGHYETAGTLTLTGSINTTKSGVTSFLDLGTGATVAAGTVVSAFGVNPANFGTVMSGRSAIIHVTNPMAGEWGSFLDLSSATGCTQDAAAGSTGGKFLKVYLNGVLYTIAMVTA